MKIKIRWYAYKRLRGWDFLPQCESWQKYGRPMYDYRHYYSVRFELRAFKGVTGVNISFTKKWKATEYT